MNNYVSLCGKDYGFWQYDFDYDVNDSDVNFDNLIMMMIITTFD